MKKIETKITIQASSDVVWNQLANIEQYSEWNPFITSIKGNCDEGNTIEVTMNIEGNKPMLFKPKITQFKNGKEFRWLGHLWTKGVFDGEHYFKLDRTGPNTTDLVHGEYFSGILSGFFYWLIGAKTKSGFQLMNKALKDRVETLNSIRHAS